MQDQSTKTALITGASSGIGKELALIHAAAGDDLILVARREERLKELKKELESQYGITVHVIPADLSVSNAPREVFDHIGKQNLRVDYLISNAGFSQQGYFHETDWKVIESMIMVNVMAMTRLAHLFIPQMVECGSGRIMFVASSAAFAPGGPLQSTYYATKSMIVSLSQGLAGELVDNGVTVTALCPGATATEFEEVSGLDKTPLFEREKVFTAKEVAKDGYEAMMNGDLVKLTGLTTMNKLILKNMNLIPTKRVLEGIRERQEKT